MPFKTSRPKLSKTRSNDNPLVQAHIDEYNDLIQSRTSFSDLRSIRRPTFAGHLKSTCEESEGTAADMAPKKNRLFRTVSASAIDQDPSFAASTSTVNSIESQQVPSGSSVEGGRSPRLPEAKTKLDIEQAINLLQELKKTATAEELVSLHRALLPTKESSAAAIPQLSAIDKHVSLTSAAPRDRRRSVMPPGLATRSGISEDPLRTREDHIKLTAASIQKNGSWFSETTALAAIHSRALSITSTGTAPDSNSLHTGAFKQGTLRITNGAASPEPGMISKLAETKHLSDTASSSASKLSSGNTEVLVRDPAHMRRRSADFQLWRSSMDSATHHAALPLAERRRKQWGLRTATAPILPAPVSTPQSSSAKVKHDDCIELPPQRHIKRNTIGHPTDLQISTDLPRFGQRWAHRAAHLSNEYMMDCDITTSPYEDEHVELPEFATRLSTVRDGDSEDDGGPDPGTDACADALLKLTGGLEASNENTKAMDSSHDSFAPNGSSNQTKHGSASSEDQRFRVVRKQDSGYCSEASNSPFQATKTSSDAKDFDTTPERPLQENQAQQEQPPPTPNVRTWNSGKKDGVDADVSSLITMHEQLSAPSTPRPNPAITSGSRTDSKKSLSPLALFKSKSKANNRRTASLAETTSTGTTFPSLTKRSSFQVDHSLNKDVVETPKRRLQKRMPEAVRLQRKDDLEKLRQSMDSSAQPNDSDSPATANEHQSGTSPVPKTIIYMVPPSRHASDADDESKSVSSTTTEKTRSTWRSRSKSFGRKRSSTIHESQAEDSANPLAPSTSTRRRSRSSVVPGTFSPKRPSMDVAAMSCLGSNENNSHAGDGSPLHKDFSSVARALGTGSQESLGENKLSAAVPKTLSKTKSTRTPRSKASSSDISGRKSGESLSRSSTTKKDLQIITPVSERTITTSSQKSVEDFFPEWQSKPASKDGSLAAQEALMLQAFPYAGPSRIASNSIPPLPELPADLDFKVSKAEEMVAKKLRLSPRSSPTTSARTSVDSLNARKQPRGKASSHPRQEPSKLMIEAKPPIVDEPAVPEASGFGDAMNAEIRPRFSFDELPKPRYQPYKAQSPSPKPTRPPDAQHPGWPGWETQSTLWRQKRASIQSASRSSADAQEKIVVETDQQSQTDNSTSPSIVVSRYITPLGFDHAMIATHSRSDSDPSSIPALQAGEEHQDYQLAEAVMRRSNSVVSTTSFFTMWSSDERPSKVNVSRVDSAFSATTTTTTVSTVSSNNSCSTSSEALDQPRRESGPGRFVAYRPQDAHAAERSRALSLAHRSCHIKEEEELQQLGLRQQHPPMPKISSDNLIDRYSGGLGYGWHREGGFSGSAGSRNASSDNVSKKSVKSQEEFGLDLTDIPIFLRRT